MDLCLVLCDINVFSVLVFCFCMFVQVCLSYIRNVLNINVSRCIHVIQICVEFFMNMVE